MLKLNKDSVLLTFLFFATLFSPLEANNPEIGRSFYHARASNSDSPGFAQGIWGAFLFILIGLSVFVAALILLLRFVLDKPREEREPPREQARHDQNQVPPEPRFKPQNRNAFVMDDVVYGDQQNAFVDSPPPSFYNNQSPDPYAPGYLDNQNFLGGEANPGRTENTFMPASDFHSPGYNTPHYGEPSSPPPEFQPAILYPPLVPRDPEEKEKSAEPYGFLEKYEPYAVAKERESEQQHHMEELSSKRAALWTNTPYKMIEDRVQGEDYDDTDTFIPASGSAKLLTKPPQLSSDSFNDGKSRMVRVLPRFHMGGSAQQEGLASPPVFVPVAPPQPSLFSDDYAMPPKY